MFEIISKHLKFTVMVQEEPTTISFKTSEKLIILFVVVFCFLSLILIPFIPLIFLKLCNYYKNKNIDNYEKDFKEDKAIPEKEKSALNSLPILNCFAETVIDSFKDEDKLSGNEDKKNLIIENSIRSIQYGPFLIEKNDPEKLILKFSIIDPTKLTINPHNSNNKQAKNELWKQKINDLNGETRSKFLKHTATYFEKYKKEIFYKSGENAFIIHSYSVSDNSIEVVLKIKY